MASHSRVGTPIMAWQSSMDMVVPMALAAAW